MPNQKIIDAVKQALQNEQKSVDIYQGAADKTKNPIVKKTMQFLADWERTHIELIQKFKADVIDHMEKTDIKAIVSEDPKQVISDFFKRNVEQFKEKLKGDPEDIKVYETGMEIEKVGYDFYKQAAADSDDPAAKEFFDFMAKEENFHYEFLQDQHYYLVKPESWFLDEERWIVEG